ncbi:MAG: oligosaccharide flippase family protein [Bacteroidales bacterium]
MQRKFLRNLVLLLVLNLLIKPFWILGIDRTVQNTVGAADYGFYFAIFNFSFLFNILLDFGITNFNNRNIAQNTQLMRKHLSKILVLKLSLFGVYLAFTFGSALVINYSREQIALLSLLAVNQFLLSLILYLRSNLSGLHLFRTDSLVSVLDRSLMIIICGVLLWGNVVQEFRIQYFVYAQTAGYLITVAIVLWIVVRKGSPGLFRLSWNYPFMLMIIRQSLPFALLVLLMTFNNRIDSVMLERMLPEGNKFAGIYAMAYRLLDASNMVGYLFSLLLLPIFARMIKERQSVEKLMKLSYTLIIIPVVILALGSIFYATKIMQLLYTMHVAETSQMFEFRMAEAARVFAILMPGLVALSTTYIFGTLLTAHGSLRKLNILFLVSLGFNIVMNYILIPKLQATGSALATLIIQSAIALIQVLIVQRIFNMKVNYGFLARLALFVAITILLNLGSRLLPFHWVISFMIMVVASLGASVAIGLLNPRNMVHILRYGDQ